MRSVDISAVVLVAQAIGAALADCPPCYTATRTLPVPCPMAPPPKNCPTLVPPVDTCTVTGKASVIPGPNPACPTTPTVTVNMSCRLTTECPSPQCETVPPKGGWTTTSPVHCTPTPTEVSIPRSCESYVTRTEHLMCPMIACVRKADVAPKVEITPNPVLVEPLPTLRPLPARVTTRACTVYKIIGAPCPKC